MVSSSRSRIGAVLIVSSRAAVFMGLRPPDLRSAAVTRTAGAPHDGLTRVGGAPDDGLALVDRSPHHGFAVVRGAPHHRLAIGGAAHRGQAPRLTAVAAAADVAPDDITRRARPRPRAFDAAAGPVAT